MNWNQKVGEVICKSSFIWCYFYCANFFQERNIKLLSSSCCLVPENYAADNELDVEINLLIMNISDLLKRVCFAILCFSWVFNKNTSKGQLQYVYCLVQRLKKIGTKDCFCLFAVCLFYIYQPTVYQNIIALFTINFQH